MAYMMQCLHMGLMDAYLMTRARRLNGKLCSCPICISESPRILTFSGRSAHPTELAVLSRALWLGSGARQATGK